MTSYLRIALEVFFASADWSVIYYCAISISTTVAWISTVTINAGQLGWTLHITFAAFFYIWFNCKE
jgi:hypothetical protein